MNNINSIVLYYARSQYTTNTRDPAIYLTPTPPAYTCSLRSLITTTVHDSNRIRFTSTAV